ncbi:hypothetical protein FB451DRAFT_1280107 [Mycena latifolia]|nr:hypothetical protein FB451DRAFT_1280107 [Mycena latifolia]
MLCEVGLPLLLLLLPLLLPHVVRPVPLGVPRRQEAACKDHAPLATSISPSLRLRCGSLCRSPQLLCRSPQLLCRSCAAPAPPVNYS